MFGRRIFECSASRDSSARCIYCTVSVIIGSAGRVRSSFCQCSNSKQTIRMAGNGHRNGFGQTENLIKTESQINRAEGAQINGVKAINSR